MKTLKMHYNVDLLKALKDQKILVYIDSLDYLEVNYTEANRNNSVVAMVASLPYTSISQIDFKDEWSQIPLIINAYNIGNYDSFFHKVNSIRHLNVRIYLSSKSPNVYTDLKILSSIGIDCGIQLEDNCKIDDDKLLDLASYYYMSPARHATIEPFEFILRHLRDESNESFGSVYFDNPLQFLEVHSCEDVINDQLEDDFDIRMQVYYNHFMDLDDCSKCPAFKICNHAMESKLTSCSTTMNEIFEYAELRNNMNSNQDTPKTICQL